MSLVTVIPKLFRWEVHQALRAKEKFEDTIIGFEGVPTGGSMKLFNSSRSMYNVLHNYLDFFAEESWTVYPVQGRLPAPSWS